MFVNHSRILLSTRYLHMYWNIKVNYLNFCCLTIIRASLCL